ncbi:disulfide isomerase/thiol-disulfide oxidase [mine drainage metagenome]|uniref:Disulfide isomerase/thiol-disulfide oxidase n=1 Tax=mine drainage metagenome TaxID=410659 RepID=A0A1J5PTN0_9ZZZZ
MLAGTVLAQIDDRVYRRQLAIDQSAERVAARQLEVSRGNLSAQEATIGADRADLAQKRDDLRRAQGQLQAADRARALARNEDDYDENPRAGSGGGLVPAAQVAPATRAELARNLKVLHAAGPYFAFPLMVWRDKAGQAQMFLGEPHDAAQLEALLATVR